MRNVNLRQNQDVLQNIIAVTNRHLCKRPFLEQIERICKCHPDAILLREKDLSADEYEELADKVLSICKAYDVPCILHTYVNAAKILGIESIHLPLSQFRQYSDDIKMGNLPYTFFESFVSIGTSVHSVAEAKAAEKLGASYITAGHIYATDCKKGLPPRGTDFLKEICESVDIPVYAIGGIALGTGQIEEVMECGALGGCIMSGMMNV
ncbi:MAG: thiamine phosphate synthase [Bariatricus sp.]|nr:thiamine phosphate synthase [Bariatricus sp.]